MNNLKSYLKPVLVLALICLVTSGILAVTNDKTAPTIEAAANAKVEKVRKEVLPKADDFEPVNVDGLPGTVTAVYKASNDAGYVFMLTAKGYGGDMQLICGMDADGKITECETLSQQETQGLGSKTTLPKCRDQFQGKDSSLEGVDTISGATISSTAYIKAIKDAFQAYDLVKGAAK